MSPFETVPPALARALSARGFEALTAVQGAVLAPELQGADLVVSAQTGSGKTVAFGLTLAATLLNGAERLPQAGAPLALIIAPTRELALQVRGELDWLYAEAGARIASCVGGMDMRDERRILGNGAHIVVGTPGRLVDHIRRGSLHMEELKAVVLDEADEMMNLGFREELEFILEAAPLERRTLMFSATMPRAIEALANTYQRNARRVNTVSAREQHADIDYRVLTTATHEAENAIFNVLRFYDAANAIVFCSTRAAVTRLASRFANRGLSVVALSGELSQAARTQALQAMRDRRAEVCVATDVAARGIDLPDLELVVHADLPKNTEGLLHRSGRTGRAGRKGASVLITPYPARRRVERLLRDANIQATWSDPPSADDIRRRDDERLLADPVLQAPAQESDRDIVRALLEAHDPVQIAAAFVRLYRKGKSPPEDLAPSSETPRHRVDRADAGSFEGFVWVSLSVGREQQAEPRWLIPMLCKAGGVTKRHLGAIRIQQRETLVEIDASQVDAFLARIAADRSMEVAVKRVDGPPPAHREARPASAKFERRERPQGKFPQGKPAAPRDGKPATYREGKPAAQRDRKPAMARPSGPPPRKKPKWTPVD